MTLTIGPDLAARLELHAQQRGITVEQFALEALQQRITDAAPQPQPRPEPEPPVVPLPIPRDEWERRLLAIASPCGVSLSDEALSREEMYD